MLYNLRDELFNPYIGENSGHDFENLKSVREYLIVKQHISVEVVMSNGNGNQFHGSVGPACGNPRSCLRKKCTSKTNFIRLINGLNNWKIVLWQGDY